MPRTANHGPRAAKFDPDAAATAGSGIYGLPFTPAEARVVIIPVPYEATTSYGGGTSRGPAAVLEASKQVDLYDHETGRPYEAGIAMLPIPRKIITWNAMAKKLGRKRVADVNRISDEVNDWVYEQTSALVESGKMPVVLGGDHSVPFGAIKAYVARYPAMGILHVDAHADLRNAYEGFTWSHASIFYNVVMRLPIPKLVQVGVRDLGAAEMRIIDGSGGRIVTFFDSDIAALKEARTSRANRTGSRYASRGAVPRAQAGVARVVLAPRRNGGRPGTPVPGGLSWNEAIGLLRAIRRAKKRIVGLDLCEVAPGKTEWDANVGARLLYKMIGFALLTQEGSS